MEFVELQLEYVKVELKNLKLKKNQNIVWKRFPYNQNNLKIVKIAINSISNRNNKYWLTYDENDIFVEKDIW